MKKRWLWIAGITLLISSQAFGNTSRRPRADDQFFENSTGSPFLKLLRSAKKTIDIETYTMNDPQADQEIRNALSRGVQVRIVEEPTPVGAACHPFGESTAASSQTADCLRQQDLVNYVNQNGGRYVPFSKDLCGKTKHCYQHGKIVIIDGNAALVSTGNFDVSNLCDHSAGPKVCDRDYTILSRDGSILRALQNVFENDLAGNSTDLGNLGTQDLTVSPNSMQPLMDFIGSATTSLQIETQYLSDPTMNQAIMDAASRGVQVSVMVASACAFGKPSASEVKKWTAIYSAFDSAGVNSRVFDSKMQVGGVAGYLHAKAIIVDGKRAWIGSVNGSKTSLTDNREYGIFINNSSMISDLNGYVSADFTNSLAQSWQDSIACQ